MTLADYLIPVNADIQTTDVILVPETDDWVNPLGVKGLGERGNVGVNAAVANAVYHASVPVRDLPIRLEKLLGLSEKISPPAPEEFRPNVPRVYFADRL